MTLVGAVTLQCMLGVLPLTTASQIRGCVGQAKSADPSVLPAGAAPTLG